MRFLKIYLLLLLPLQLVKAQNLIPDSSFEQNKFIPMDFSSVGASNTWSVPSWGTSDLFCKCDRKTKEQRDKAYSDVDVPQNSMGYQFPHSGICYAGMFLFSHGDYREYLQTPLTRPLEKNKTYRFSFYISMADYSTIAIDQLGVCFMKDKADYRTSDVIMDLHPVYADLKKEIGKDVEDWHRVSVRYKAQGGESYVLFGSFDIKELKKTKLKAPKEIKSRINQSIERDAYYYVDDVSLVELPIPATPDSTDLQEQVTEDSLYPDATMVLKNILFRSNESRLLPASCSELNRLVIYLKENPSLQMAIFGHTDNSGNAADNLQLSIERANAVANYLIAAGIEKTRLLQEGFGSNKPIASNATPEGRQKNRRVEIRLSPS